MNNRLKKIRIACGGLSQRELAFLLSVRGINVSHCTIRNLENGSNNVRFRIISAVADYFNVSTNYLMGLSNAESPNEKMIDMICCYQAQFLDDMEELYEYEM